MPRIEPELQRLQDIKTLPSLIKYLKDDLNWPIESEHVEDVVFDYDPSELGFDSASTAKIEEVCQLRPLSPGQKWGVFWVKFGKKQLPVQMLRRALGNLVVKKRGATKKADKAAWHMHDLLFISAYGDDSNRHVTFAHFSESEDSKKSLPVLKVLGWDEDDTLLHLRDTYKTLVNCLNWETTPTDDPEAWRAHWSKAFKLTHKEVINTTKELVVELAHLATIIKKSVLKSINAETEKGPWKKLMLAFQKTLIKDLNEEQFADVIAQTISYGLLTARLSSDGQINLKNLVDMVPSTNPFLKELLQHFLTSAGMKGLFDVDEAGINAVVDLLNRANTQAIRTDFGKKTDGEDPVIHFYEHFLGAYNKKLKVERGVFYTPKPIVSYIVRSVHELLQTEFGLEDGLADTSTWSDVLKRYKDLKTPEGIKDPSIEPFVQILDPATGTATFLIEVIEVIHNTMTAKWNKERILKADQIKKWNTYVPTHLLPRLYAYELMMAPYAIAHMKVGIKLTETGFTAWDKISKENRANIFLTNALEPWDKQLTLVGFDALAHEAAAVNEIKHHKCFTVVIGNPPYSNFGMLNKIPSITSLLEDYKRGLDEKKINLDDDFIKFVRLSQSLCETAGAGVLGMITNNSYVDGITHRQMRQSLMGSFKLIHVLNLHGSSKKKEKAPDGSDDENVFDIQQGVATTLAVASSKQKSVEVFVHDLWGKRETKYATLDASSVRSGTWTRPKLAAPYFFFANKNLDDGAEYNGYLGLKDIFMVSGNGVKTERDGVSIHFTKGEIESSIRDFQSLDEATLRQKYETGDDSRDWTVKKAKSDAVEHKGQALYRRLLYRPFDIRHTWYSGQTRGFMGTPAFPTMRHMKTGNIAMVTTRQTAEKFDLLCTDNLIGHKSVAGYDINTAFPLYLFEDVLSFDLSERHEGSSQDSQKRPNLSGHFLKSFSTALQLPQKGAHGLPSNLTPEDIFNYAYAVLHSPAYRNRYAEFLKIDFPRLPLIGNLEFFQALARLGNELTALHLLESPKLAKFITEFIGGKNPEVEKISWSQNTVWIDKAQTTGFQGVCEEIWGFQIGGYQVCEKWLKDRKCRKLTKDDIEHYQKVVIALSETIRLMAEIDKVIDQYGGWPVAFQSGK